MYKVLPYVLALRIYQIGTPRLSSELKPPVTYACLDLINEARAGNKAPPVELHVPGTANEHLEVVRPVYDGNRLVGYLQLALHAKAIDVWTNSIISDSYIEIYQRAGDQPAILINKGGDANLKLGKAEYYKVEGTRWNVAVWSKISVPILPLTLESLFIFLVAVVLAAMVVYLLKNSVSRAVLVDAKNLIMMTTDSIRGNKKHGYHLHLPEFVEAARGLTDVESGGQVERERDDDPDAINISADDLDPLSMSSAGLSVEELDEDDASVMMRHIEMQKQQAQPVTDSGEQKAVFESRDVSQDTAQMQDVSGSMQSGVT